MGCSSFRLPKQFHEMEESEKREVNYIELVVPHFFCNSSYYSQTNCFLCKEKKKNTLFCPLFSSIDKNLLIKDLLQLYDYPNQPIFLLAKCKYYDIKNWGHNWLVESPIDATNIIKSELILKTIKEMQIEDIFFTLKEQKNMLNLHKNTTISSKNEEKEQKEYEDKEKNKEKKKL